MAFSSLRTVSFRNLSDSEVDLRGKDIFLVGENGQGKSNFLEALYFCSYASSFRGVRDRDMAKTGEKGFSAGVSMDNSFYSAVNIVFGEGQKKVALDGKRLEDRKELLSVLPCIIFCHEDMDFVSGTPERRRWFFDQTRSLWDGIYLDDLRRYRYVLKNRSALLKNSSSSETSFTLDALDSQMALYGLELVKKRKEIAEEFSSVFEPLYREISGIGGIRVKYSPSWKHDDVDSVIAFLKEKRESDVLMSQSQTGPNRDRYIFTCEGEDFSAKASTGQRRLLALLLRTAQTRVFSEKTGKKPVLLLDDVLLELDGEKRRKFLELMPDYEQAFFTFLPIEPYENYLKPGTLVYTVSQGQLERRKAS